MSCSYADGLSPYEDKGVLGTPERVEDATSISSKCATLASWWSSSRHVVVHTGAGISTSAGIPDFRGPNGVWTLEKRGEKPAGDVPFGNALPTYTHMALRKLLDQGRIQHIVSQNVDGLHFKSGIPRGRLSELHGNVFSAKCERCGSEWAMGDPQNSVGQRSTGERCKRGGRACRGTLHDTVLDWEAGLPERDLELAECHSTLADLNVCLGTTLQIVPSGNLPLSNKRHGGKVVIVNLQPTKHDKKADLIINAYVDDVMRSVVDKMGIEVLDYDSEKDPVRDCVDWTLYDEDVTEVRSNYSQLMKEFKRRKAEERLNAPKAKKKFEK